MNENNQGRAKPAFGHGGARANSGRKRGAATKRTREIADAAIRDGITPLEYMLQVMRQEIDPELAERDLLQALTLRFEAAKAAAPYIHPRLQAVEVTGADGEAIKMSIAVTFG